MTKRNNRKQERKTGIFATARKVSEMIWQFAGEFIGSGKTLEEKQNRLNAACSAWNMACIPPEVRNRSLNQYIESYQSYNPDVSDEQISGVRSNMEYAAIRAYRMTIQKLRICILRMPLIT